VNGGHVQRVLRQPLLHVLAKVQEHAQRWGVVVVERKVRDPAVEPLCRVRPLRAQVVKFVVVLLGGREIKRWLTRDTISECEYIFDTRNPLQREARRIRGI